jgi:1-phosphatidylinositol phosphodiesterase
MATELHEMTSGEVARGTEPGPDPAASGWNYRNYMFGAGIGSPYMPALTTHGGKMCCLFANNGDKVLYYAWGTRTSWENPKPFTGAPSALSSPALADDGSVLHAVFTDPASGKNDLVHYQYDDSSGQWLKRCALAQHSSVGPALAGYHGQLYCVFVAEDSRNTLYYTIWNPRDGWRKEKSCGELSKGTPALCVIGDELHLLFAANNDDRIILDLVYNEAQDTWSRSTAPLGEAAEYGVSAAGAGAGSSAGAFMGFLARNSSGDVLVCTYADGRWQANEKVASSYSTPGLAVQDDYVNCAFTARNGSRDLLWSQRPVAGLDFSTWMGSVADAKLLSSLSIPGTHDSCAISMVPYAGTQYLTITEQLDAGIRFFDLRCGLVDDVLYMYHGDIYLGLTLRDVLSGIYSWQDGHPSEAVITSIKQDHRTEHSTVSFAAAVKAQFDSAPDRWYLTDATPSLGQARRKIVLMRRYAATGPEAVGIDVTKWPDNSPRFDITTPGGVALTVQDMYNLTGTSFDQIISSKMNAIVPLLDDAGTGASGHWYLNFTSGAAYNFQDLTFGTPYEVAVGGYGMWEYIPGVNPRLWEDLSKRGTVRYGALLMDFPEVAVDDLITVIVAANL